MPKSSTQPSPLAKNRPSLDARSTEITVTRKAITDDGANTGLFRSRFDRNNIVQFIGLVLLIPVIGLLLTLIPRANPVTGNSIAAEAPGAVEPSNARNPSSESLGGGPATSFLVDDPYTPPNAEEAAAAADSIAVLPRADRPAFVVGAPTNGSQNAKPTPKPDTPTPESADSLPAPGGVSASNSNTIGIDVKWNAVGSATQYHLYRSSGSSKPVYYRTVKQRTNFRDDARAGTYRYYIVAANGLKLSPPSKLTRSITVGARVKTPLVTGSQAPNGVITITPKAFGADRHNLYRNGVYQTTINNSSSFKVQPTRGTHKYYVVGVKEESSGSRFSERSNELSFTWP